MSTGDCIIVVLPGRCLFSISMTWGPSRLQWRSITTRVRFRITSPFTSAFVSSIVRCDITDLRRSIALSGYSGSSPIGWWYFGSAPCSNSALLGGVLSLCCTRKGFVSRGGCGAAAVVTAFQFLCCRFRSQYVGRSPICPPPGLAPSPSVV